MVVWYYHEYSMNEWVDRFVVSDEVEERLIHMIDTAKELSPYSKEYVKQQINQTLIKKKQRYIMYSLNSCKNDFDELSNKANDFHEGSRYANAAAKVQDIINYLNCEK